MKRPSLIRMAFLFHQTTPNRSRVKSPDYVLCFEPGLHLTAANTARQLKELLPEREFTSLVIPLMRIVKDEDAETSAGIVAAVALSGLRSAKGDFVISRTAEFTQDQRVKTVCSWLSHNRKVRDRDVLREISALNIMTRPPSAGTIAGRDTVSGG
jgi:hypothetical protein